MPRALRIAAFSALFFFGTGAAFIAAIFYTPPGRAFLIDRAEAAIESELGGEANITAIRGRLPGYIIVDNLVLTENSAPWARIDMAELRWRPFRLIGGDVVIDSLIVNGGAILREPPEQPADDEPFAIKLPEELPSLRIDDIQITNLQSSLGGVAARVDGGGGVHMGGRRIDARLNLTSANDADTIDLTVNIAPNAERILIDATIASQENGIVASVADLGGPLFLEIKSDSPPERALITVTGRIGAYGDVKSDLLADLTNAVSVEANGEFAAGVRFSDIEELAEPVRFNFALQDEDRGGRIFINRILSAAGAFAGDIVWKGMRSNDNSLNAEIRATLADDYRTEIQEIVGKDLTLAAGLQRRRDDYGLNLKFRGDGVNAAIENATTDLRKKIAGDFSAVLAPRDAPLVEETILAAKIDADLDETVSLRAVAIDIGELFHVEGDADFAMADNTLRADGDLTAAPAFVEMLAPSFRPRDDITARFDAAGAADLFTLTATIDTPDIVLGDNTAPALTAEIALSGLPKLPTGDIKATAKNGNGRFAATLRSSQTGRIAAPSIAYTGAGFNLDGAGAYNPETQSGEIDLTYEGGDNASPWPGVNVAGAFQARGTFAREGQRTDLTISADALRVNDLAVDRLALRAVGPPNAIETSASAGRLILGGDTEISDIELSAAINPTDAVTIRIAELNAAFAENVARLLEPGVIVIRDGVNLQNIRLGWGRRGRIAIDGAFSSSRWRGDFELVDVNIPQTDGRATATLTLDTDADQLAGGNFALTSLISDEEASISGALAWDGAALLLTSLPDKDALDMRLALPARLNRSPSLSISTEGEINGYVRYDGAIEPFAAFMPPELQTLEGFLAINFDVAGTTENPSLAGVAEITEGAYTELRSGLSIAGLHTRAVADVSGNGSTISFSGGARGGGQSGDDTISIGGDMTLADISRIDLDITLANAALSAFPVNTVRADGAVNIAGPLDEIAATGSIAIKELDAEIITPETTGLVPIEVVNITDLADDDAYAPAPKASTITYNIDIDADDRIFIRGRGLDSEWSAGMRAISVRGEPIILGAMRLRRGTIDFSGRRFDIARGVITFDRLSPNNPLLDIRAEFETSEGVTATIEITGRAQEPSIELNSTPSLPDEDIMALVLFGKPADELTAFESLQTAQALASLGGIGPFGGTGVTGSLRRATGLDMLNFDIDPENGGGSLTVGKYVADGLFVSATQDAQGKGGAVIVEYEITDNISVETEVRQDGDQTVSANWKKDF